MSHTTKQKLADSLETLVNQNGISKVTVSDVVKKSGLSRQTFYNHFADIYDLLFWTHEIRTREAIDTFWEEEDFRHAFCTSMSIMQNHKSFYQQIIKKEGANSFQNSYKTQNISLSRIRIQNVSGKAPDAETNFLLTLYWCGASQMLVDWILKGMKEDPQQMAELFYAALPLPLRQYWTK